MSIFSNLFKGDAKADVAVLKQDAVFALWEVQQRAAETLTRCARAGSLSESQLQGYIEKINQARQTLQDTFLLNTSLKRVQEGSQNAQEKLVSQVDVYVNDAISQEHQMDGEERLRNINESFKRLFKELYTQRRIDAETMLTLESQVEIYNKGLHESMTSEAMRPNIKDKLVHEMIDDYYRQIHGIYLDTISTRKRL